MVRKPYFDSTGMKKGAWSKEEDDILKAYVYQFGHPNWRALPVLAGLARCGKSCRLRWENYLKPDLKRGKFTQHEVDLVIKLHDQLGNKWSAIAAKLPGRTDNEIKNYWHAHISKYRKRTGAVTITTTTGNEVRQGLSVESTDVQESVADSCSVVDQTFLGEFDIDPPPYLDQDLFDGLSLCQIDMSLFSDSSPTSDAFWNSTITECQQNFWFEPNEEDTFYVELW